MSAATSVAATDTARRCDRMEQWYLREGRRRQSVLRAAASDPILRPLELLAQGCSTGPRVTLRRSHVRSSGPNREEVLHPAQQYHSGPVGAGSADARDAVQGARRRDRARGVVKRAPLSGVAAA